MMHDSTSSVLYHFFPNFFQIQSFPKKLWKSLEKFGKVWKTLENLFQVRSISPKEHVRSVTIYPTRSENFFHTGVRQFDHGSGYNDDTIKKFKCARRPTRLSAGPVRYSPAPAQGRLRPGPAVENTTRHSMASARREESIADNAHSVKDHHSSAPEFQTSRKFQ